MSTDYKVWECIVCGIIYNEALGWPEEGLAPGTRWEDVPDTWLCPDCGVGKDDFEMAEVSLDQPSGMPGMTPVTAVAKPAATEAQPLQPASAGAVAGKVYRQWECIVCGIVYDEAQGWPDDGINPGTRWEDVPEDWLCPDCGVGKADFEMLEVGQSFAAVVQPQEVSQPVAAGAPALTTFNVDNSKAPVVIVGTGLAGYNLAREFRKLDKTTPLVFISRDDGNFYSKPQLSTGFAKQKSAQALVTASAENMALELQARIIIYADVTAIDSDNKTLTIERDLQKIQNITYSKLVLATGAECIQIPMQGSAAGEVYSVNDLMDYARFRTAALGCKKVLVIGAGLIGSEYANDLVQAGFEVDVVDPMATPLASLLPPAAGELLQQRLTDAGVNFHFGTVVEQLNRKGQMIEATLKNGDTVEADLVLSAVGVKARVQLAELAGAETNRGIVTDRTLQTSVNDIYSLGDCAEVDGHLLYYIAPLMAAARVLARTLNGEETEVHYGAMPVAVKTTLCPVVVSPPARQADGQLVEGEWEIDATDTGVTASYMNPQGELLGFALVGDATKHKDGLTQQIPEVMA